MTKIHLRKDMFQETAFCLLETDGLSVHLFRYSTGVEAVKLQNDLGYLLILPFMGQMIWDAQFEGHDLKMESMFSEPQNADDILGTYGCYMYHAGILRNGNADPNAPEDTHALHGEFPCAKAQNAYIELGENFVSLTSEYEYIKGFGDHYLATPNVTLFRDSSLFDMEMNVKNLASNPMDVMYMMHMNNAFIQGAKIHQMADFTQENMKIRDVIPSHVTPNQAWLDFMAEAKINPSITEILDQPQSFDPEVVYFIKNLKVDAEGNTHLFMEYPEGGGQYCSYDPSILTHLTRWILHNGDQKVAAFALPGTCDPDGYTSEKKKGHILKLEPSQSFSFHVKAGYMNKEASKAIIKIIKEQ